MIPKNIVDIYNDNFIIKSYDIKFDKKFKKINYNLYNEYMQYSLKYNSKFFENYEVNLYGSFNSELYKTANDLDFQVVIDTRAFTDMDYAIKYLDTLYDLYKFQMDISSQIFGIFTDILFVDKLRYKLDTNSNYLNKETEEMSDVINFFIVDVDSIELIDKKSTHTLPMPNRYYKAFSKRTQRKPWLTTNYTSGKTWNQYQNGIKKYSTLIKTIDDLNKTYVHNNLVN
jgi:hypothetical protein